MDVAGRIDWDLWCIDGTTVRTRYLVGADRARSRVARCFGLGSARRFLTGLERILNFCFPKSLILYAEKRKRGVPA